MKTRKKVWLYNAFIARTPVAKLIRHVEYIYKKTVNFTWITGYWLVQDHSYTLWSSQASYFVKEIITAESSLYYSFSTTFLQLILKRLEYTRYKFQRHRTRFKMVIWAPCVQFDLVTKLVVALFRFESNLLSKSSFFQFNYCRERVVQLWTFYSNGGKKLIQCHVL